MAHNSSTPDGAASLDTALTKDHSGSLLESIESLFGGGSSNPDGGNILGHVFGDKTSVAAETVAQKTGIDAATVANILSFAAPLIMAALAKKKTTAGLDAGGVSDLLKNQTAKNGNPLMSIATAMLDKNGDGNVVDDLLGGLFTKH
ncbi:DUF937 domain-containing protein [Candidatus Saccharibacteria bacterium]|nr:MAG: DUF937 domain-containing protein [Candidatus Saccharibacteria bacterium]